MEPPAQPAVPPPQVPKSKGGCACCAMGCTTMFVVALVGLAMIVGICVWGFGKLVNEYTATEPIAIQTTASEAEFTSANAKLDSVRAAAHDKKSVTVEFTAAEINALIARHPDFADMRGKFRVALANSLMTLDMSVPLREIHLPRIRDRWLNGTARFGMIYHEGNFSFSLRSLTASGHDLSMSFMQSFSTAFNERFNEGFNKSRNENERSNDFWESVKTLAVIDDKLVLTTMSEATEEMGAEDEAEPSPTPAAL